MLNPMSQALSRFSAGIAAALLFAGCGGEASVGPDREAGLPAQFATGRSPETNSAIATLQRVTARYHSLDAAIADGFELLHECENRPGEGPVGTVYVSMARLLDGRIDASSPDALIYEPGGQGGPKLVGVEFAVVNSGQEPPEFLGQTFQPEDEFGVFALHVWVWRHNPDGLFAESNPRVSCEP